MEFRCAHGELESASVSKLAATETASPKLVTIKTYKGISLTRRRIQLQAKLGDPFQVNATTVSIVVLFGQLSESRT